MPMTTCGHCGAPAYITEREREAGSEVYCSEACANGRPDDQFDPPVETPDDA